MVTKHCGTLARVRASGSIGLAIAGSLVLGGPLLAQDELEATGRAYLANARELGAGYSRAVVTRGGDMVWISGTAGPRDDNGQPLTEFKDQARQAFRNLDGVLRQADGDLSDLVSITVMLRDARYYEAYTEVRREFFPDGRFPSGAIVADVAFVNPEYMVLLQAVAVIKR